MFDRVPSIVIVYGPYGLNAWHNNGNTGTWNDSFIWSKYQTKIFATNPYNPLYVTETEYGIQWYCDDLGSTVPSYQLNASGKTYYYVAVL